VTPIAAAAAPAKPVAKKPFPSQPVAAKAADSRRKVTFTYFAPEAATVLVAGDFTKWESSPIRLVKETTGQWKATVALAPGKYQYRLLVDGHWQNDPACPEVQPNEFGSQNCVLSVAA
jgi:1,4-alpha-glucan branching enzyme